MLYADISIFNSVHYVFTISSYMMKSPIVIYSESLLLQFNNKTHNETDATVPMKLQIIHTHCSYSKLTFVLSHSIDFWH